MRDFDALLIEGVFFQKDSDDDCMGGLHCQLDNGQQVSVINAMMRLNGSHVQISVHHLPPMPPDPTKQGGGCCLWGGNDPRFQSAGGTTFCPFGHHKEPTKLLNVVANGILKLDVGFYDSETTFVVHQFDGTEVKLPFQHHLPGHYGRIAAATFVDIDKMKDILMKSGGLDAVEGMGQKATDLRDLLGRLADPKKGG